MGGWGGVSHQGMDRGVHPLVNILELGPVFGASLQDSHSPLMHSLTQQHDCMHHTVPQSPAQPNPNPKQDAPPKSNHNQPGTRHRGEEGSRPTKTPISPGRGEPLSKSFQEGPYIRGNQPLGREAHQNWRICHPGHSHRSHLPGSKNIL